MVFQDRYCEKCGEKYTDKYNWCEPCQINYLKENFTNWTSGNEKVDDFIQEMQLKINYYNDVIVEWIPFNQFDKIKEVNATLRLAIWKDGPLYYCLYKKEYVRKSGNQKVFLTYLLNSPNITNEFIDEV